MFNPARGIDVRASVEANTEPKDSRLDIQFQFWFVMGSGEIFQLTLTIFGQFNPLFSTLVRISY